MKIDFAQIQVSTLESLHDIRSALRNPQRFVTNLGELSLVKKIEIGTVAAVVLAAVLGLYLNWGFWVGGSGGGTGWEGGGSSDVIQTWGGTVKTGKEKLPVKVTVISGTQGRLEVFTEGKGGEGGVGSRFAASPELQNWPDQLSRLRDVRDPTNWMLTLAGIGIAEQRGWTLPGTVTLSDEQKPPEQQARKSLTEDLAALEATATDGSLDSGLSRQVASALETFQYIPVEATAKRNRAGQEVVRLGMKYAAKYEDQKAKVISQYVDTVYSLLDETQRAALAKLGQNLEAGVTLATPATSRSTAPASLPATGISSTPGVR